MVPEQDIGPENAACRNPKPTCCYGSAAEGLQVLNQEFNYWSEKLSDRSFQLSLALIGANWAVFGSGSGIFINPWARLSIFSVILCLGINLVGTRYMSDMLRKQFDYGASDPTMWEQDFKKNNVENRSMAVYWEHRKTREVPAGV